MEPTQRSLPTPQGATLIGLIVLGGLGMLVSWAFFADWIMTHGSDFLGFWTLALTQEGIAGMTWDLVASGAMVTVLVWHHRQTLGWSGTIAVCLSTWFIGVCVGLAVLYALLARASKKQEV